MFSGQGRPVAAALLNNLLSDAVLDDNAGQAGLNAGGGWQLYLSIGFYVVALVVILALAVYASRYLSKKNKGGGGASRLRVIDRVFLGKDQQVAVIAAGERFYLVGITPGGITNLGELGQDEVVQGFAPAEDSPGFKSVFLKSVRASLGMPDRSDKPGTKKPERDSKDEET